MPDIKTALTTALEQGKRQYLQATISDWEHHEQEIRTQPQPQQEKAMQATQPTPTFTTTGVISKDTFEFIKQNSGKYKGSEIAKELSDKHDFNPASVLAIITQLKGTGMIVREDSGFLVCRADEYRPVTDAYKKTLKERQRQAQQEKKARRLESLAKAREVRAANVVKRRTETPKKVTKAAPATQGIAALQPAPTLPVLPNLPTAESVLNNMSIIEARKLFDELKKIFG